MRTRRPIPPQGTIDDPFPFFFTDMQALVMVIRARRRELGWSQLELDHRAGLPDGYTGKLESDPARKNYRGVGYLALPLILQALKLEMCVVRAAAKHKPRTLMPHGLHVMRGDQNPFWELGSKGGLKRAANLTSKQRQRLASKAAKARWKRYRERERVKATVDPCPGSD